MKRWFDWDKKYLYAGLTAFLVVAASLALFTFINYVPALLNAVKRVLTILSPFIWGAVLTYLLLPLMRQIEHLFLKTERKHGRKPTERKLKTVRVVSLIFSEIMLLVIIMAFIDLIIPQVYASIETIVVNSPVYFEKFSQWVTSSLDDYPETEKYITGLLNTFESTIIDFVKNQILPTFGNMVTNFTNGVFSVLKGVYNLLIGIIVSIYILSNVENAGAGCKKILYSLFSIKTAENILKSVTFIDRIFTGFLTGKLLDSAIIGVICYIACMIARMPFTLLVSVIIGITNIIPFFGPLIGGVIGAFIILLVNPVKCLVFIIFALILQQIDGNILGPKILGSTVGINGFWIMFSIIIGGGLFGFAGMILGVPVFVVIYTALRILVENGLRKKELPSELEAYRELESIDQETGELHKRKSITRRSKPIVVFDYKRTKDNIIKYSKITAETAKCIWKKTDALLKKVFAWLKQMYRKIKEMIKKATKR